MNSFKLGQLAKKIIFEKNGAGLSALQYRRIANLTKPEILDPIERMRGVSLALAITQGCFTPATKLRPLFGELTRDSEGYVFFDGIHVEHFSFYDKDAEAAAAQRLNNACLHALEIGVPVNARSAICPVIASATKSAKWLIPAMICYTMMHHAESGRKLLLAYTNMAEEVCTHPIISLQVNNDVVPLVGRHNDAYTAFHHYQDLGWKSVSFDEYTKFQAFLEDIGVSIADIVANTGYNYLT